MAYTIDLHTITLSSYKDMIKDRYTIPSQMILREEIDTRFSVLEKEGITNAGDLLNFLKQKENFNNLCKHKLFTEDYVKVLLRQLKGMLAKPRKLSEFVWIDSYIISQLEQEGIKNSSQLYGKIVTKAERKKLCTALSLKETDISELVHETDLTRIQWVNHTFAKVLYEAGYKTISSIQTADFQSLYDAAVSVNREKQLYKGNIGLNDMKILIDLAKDIQEEVEY